MPTETKDKSPLQVAPAVALAAGKMAIGAATNILNTYKANKESGKYDDKKGLGKAGSILFDAWKAKTGGVWKGLTGMDNAWVVDPNKESGETGGDNYDYAKEFSDQATRLSIMEAKEDSPIAMSGVIKPKKELSAITMSYAPMKMKAKEAERGALMMKISGASTMPEKY